MRMLIPTSNQVKVDRMIGIYTGERRYNFNDIDVLPIKVFIDELYKGNIF
jgi:hypothetical protein